MSHIERADEGGLAPDGFWELAERVFGACLALEGVENAYACVKLISGAEMRNLNRETRGADYETDVLSYPSVSYPTGVTARGCMKRLKRAYDPARGQLFLGDIALNVCRAGEQAREYGHSHTRELGYLTAHALFHLLGYDHALERDKIIMRDMEKRAMRSLGLFRGEDKRMTDNELKQAAIEALELSYSPYSRYRVGACLLSEDGRAFTGANFENASYGATICAERCCVANGIAHGARAFTKIAIAVDSGVAWPCGVCRQVLNEFKCGDMLIMVGSPGGEWRSATLSELLPESFGPRDLNVNQEDN